VATPPFGGLVTFHGELAGLAEPAAFTAWLGEQDRHDWVVYAKEPFAGLEVVLKYLARYTHRVALSNGRMRRLDGDTVEPGASRCQAVVLAQGHLRKGVGECYKRGAGEGAGR